MVGGNKLGWVSVVVAIVVAGCSHDATLPCDPTDESCNVAVSKGNPCRIDADCGDGKCLPDGTCQAPGTQSQDSACKNVTCGAGQFCSNGACLAAGPSCKAADPACIYIPHGSFEPPVHAWWWPWLTPDGPDDKAGKDAIRPDLEYPDYVQVMSTPVVMRLHKADNEPAVVFNAFPTDQPNVVESQGVMRAIRGSDGSPIWTAPKDMFQHMEWSVDGNSSIAAGDCTGNGEVCFVTGGWDPNDINVCDSGTCRLTRTKTCSADWQCDSAQSHQHGGLIAFGSDGRFMWVNREAQVWWGGPSIARLLGPTGPAQIVVGNGVYDGATGKTLCPQTLQPLDQVTGNGDGALTAIADIDLDGIPEIVTGNQAYKLLPDGKSPTGYTCKPTMGAGVQMPGGKPCAGGYQSQCADGFPAIANFAGYGTSVVGLRPDDPHPQVVVVSHGTLRIHDWTGGMLLSPIALPGDATRCPGGEFNAGGPPTIADFDGDGLPEVGVASQGAYSVWKPGKGFIWQQRTYDCSASTGSSVFDFEGKGQATAVYSDQCFLHVLDGKTGTPLIKEKNASCTAYETPIVADIDGTGRAKILVPNNNICNYPCADWGANGTWCQTDKDCPTGQACYPTGVLGNTTPACYPSQLKSRSVGLKALMSPTDKWVNTRSVWNEHTYHVSNVNLDGTLPWPEQNSWAPGQSNSYRQNVQGQGVFSAPDLSICDVKIDMTQCQQGSATVTTTVYNGGAKQVMRGVTVTFYAELTGGGEAKIGVASTTNALAPGASEQVSIKWVAPPARENVVVKAIVDEGQSIGECHYDNNATTSAAVKCPPLG